MAVCSSSNFASTLFPLVLTITFVYSTSATRDLAQKTSTQFIKTSCSSTAYPRLCYSSLSNHASVIQTSPKLLANTALSVTLANAESTSNMMSKLSQSHGLTPREVAAMRDCVEQLSDSVDELRRSLGEMSNFKGTDFGLMMNDVQTWVSAALTEENTCADGFQSKTMNGDMKNVVRGRIVTIAHLTSNALALINNYASLHT